MDRIGRKLRQVLRQAFELREEVRRNLERANFRNDDVQMKRYNDLAQAAAALAPADPVLNGEMVIMPDAVLQAFTYPWGNPRAMPLDMPSRRLEEHLNRLIGRLELLLDDDDLPTGSSKEAEVAASVADPAQVFVVHGRDWQARDAMLAFLRSLSLRPMEWSAAVAATGKGSPYVGEVLDRAFDLAQAVVVLMTPDDLAVLRPALHGASEPTHETQVTPQARPNVLFEAGMAMGRSPDRTVLVEMGSLRPFSDVGGRHVVRFDGSTQRRQDVANRLRAAGCPVDASGTDWHTAGAFPSYSGLTIDWPASSPSGTTACQ